MSVSDARLAEVIVLAADYLPIQECHLFGEDARDLMACLRELQQRREADAWRPIESAPKDGTRVLCGRHNVAKAWVGQYVTGTDKYWRDEAGNYRDPTAWKPLPPGPAGEGE